MSQLVSAKSEDTIVVFIALDTKGEEARFVRDCIRNAGLHPLVVDVGVLGEPLISPDISNSEVAAAGGSSLELLRLDGDRNKAIEVMSAGATCIASRLYASGRLAGVLAVGGSGGTTIGTAAMRTLPLGVPKLMVSTLVAGDIGAFVGSSDICMLNSVIDFCGVNTISQAVLRNAAAAISGMVRASSAPKVTREKPLIAASMFGVTTTCISEARSYLREVGFELVPFHATGSGGRSMEALIDEGVFIGVLDLTITEWADEVVGGMLSAGPSRLEAGARSGLPQVIAPGAVDMVNFVGSAALPDRFSGRCLHQHNPDVILMRTTAEECHEIGRRVAEKLNQAKGPVAVLFPLRGLSALDVESGPFFDPDADRSLLDALVEHCRPAIEIIPLDVHINDPAFAHACCSQLLTFIESPRGR